MNYNAVLWLSGFMAGLGAGIGLAALCCRLLPINARVKSESVVHVQFDEPQDEADKWKET